MKNELRRSIFRMMSDLIKSDDIITTTELDALDGATKAFSIKPEDKEAGHAMTMEDAVRIISAEDTATKRKIRDAMLSIAVNDNECCRAEAMLLMLMDYICEGEDACVKSFPMRNRSLLSTQIIYLDNRVSSSGAHELEQDFAECSQLVRLAGLELIYIPAIAKHFNEHTNQSDLRRLLALISPSSSSEDIDNTLSAIKGMSTKFFYDNVIRGKLAMELDLSDPVWLIRLPDSNVAGNGYINFLSLKVRGAVRSQLSGIINRLNSRQGSYSVMVNTGWGNENSFLYGGFYKAMLDLMSVRKIDKWDIHIRLYGDGAEPFRCIAPDGSVKKYTMTLKRGAEELPVPLAGRDIAFYLLICCASAESKEAGIDFHDDSIEALTQVRYAQLFHSVSRRSEEPLVWDPAFRVPMRSRVASALNNSAVAEVSSLQSLYVPKDMKRGLLRVDIEPERIIIDSVTGSVPLKESSIYRMYQHPAL